MRALIKLAIVDVVVVVVVDVSTKVHKVFLLVEPLGIPLKELNVGYMEGEERVAGDPRSTTYLQRNPSSARLYIPN